MEKETKFRKFIETLRRQKTTKTKTTEKVNLSDYVVISSRTPAESLERLEKSETVQKKNEILYRSDPIIFNGVNRLTRSISQPDFFFMGDAAEVKKMEEFSRRIEFKTYLENATKDIVIYGYSVAQKVRGEDGQIKSLIILDPKSIDWKKDGDKIVRDEHGVPEGLIWTDPNGQDKELLMKDAILLRFFTLGPETLGISPLEPAYKASWIRMNLEEAYGEAMYRIGYPTMTFTIGDADHPTSPELIKEAKKVLANMDTASQLILPNWIKGDVLSSKSDLKAVIDLWIFLAGEEARALDQPLIFVVPMGQEKGVGQADIVNLDFEKAIKHYQLMLLEQLDSQLLNEVKGPNVQMKFREENPETQMLRVRKIAMLMKNGLKLSKKATEQLHKELDLPLDDEEESHSATENLEDYKIVENEDGTFSIMLKDEIITEGMTEDEAKEFIDKAKKAFLGKYYTVLAKIED